MRMFVPCVAIRAGWRQVCVGSGGQDVFRKVRTHAAAAARHLVRPVFLFTLEKTKGKLILVLIISHAVSCVSQTIVLSHNKNFLRTLLRAICVSCTCFCARARRKLSDVDGDNRLTLAEFSVAMHIIMKVWNFSFKTHFPSSIGIHATIYSVSDFSG